MRIYLEHSLLEPECHQTKFGVKSAVSSKARDDLRQARRVAIGMKPDQLENFLAEMR